LITLADNGILAIIVETLVTGAVVVGVDGELNNPAVGLIGLLFGVFEETSDRGNGDGDEDAEDGNDDDKLDERESIAGLRYSA
jgi:hypothetical protein